MLISVIIMKEILLSLVFLLLASQANCGEPDWSQLDDIVNAYIDNGSFPGAALRIANKTHMIYSENYGHFNRNSPPISSPFVTN